MLQKTIIIGNLGSDPSMKFTQSGEGVTNFSVAASERFTSNGQLVERTVWFRITVWGKQAETCNTFLKKGSKVYIEGRLTADENGCPRLFTRKDGSTGAVFEVKAEVVRFLSPKGDGESAASAAPIAAKRAAPNSPSTGDVDIPF